MSDDRVNFKIVETDNFGGDYPDEKFLPVPDMTKERATRIAALINHQPQASRYWKVVESDYVLVGGFEP